MENSDFLVKFQQSLDRLGQINEIVKQNSQNRQKFVQLVRGRLNIVNEKVTEINNSIKNLKEQLTALQQQVTDNTTGIANRDANVNRLNAQIERLNAEKIDLQNQIQTLNQNAQALQQRIDQCESQIRDLTTQNQSLSQQIEELNRAATQSGEQGAAQAATIQRMTDENTAQIEQLKQQHIAELDAIRQQNDAKIAELQQKIEGYDRQITDANSQSSQMGDQLNVVTRERDEARSQISQLQQQISELQDQNRDLIQRIISATQTINEAMDTIQGITSDPSQQQDIEEMSRSFQDVEDILQQISNTIQGQQGASQAIVQSQATSQPQRIDRNTEVVIDNAGNKMNFLELLSGLRRKVNQRPDDPNFKYRLALNELVNNTDPNTVASVLRKYNIDFNEGRVIGGQSKVRKTKKLRKQKGGFVYTTPSPKFKRTSRTSKSITGSKSKSRSSKSSRSSRSSSSNLDKSSYSSFFKPIGKGTNKRRK